MKLPKFDLAAFFRRPVKRPAPAPRFLVGDVSDEEVRDAIRSVPRHFGSYFGDLQHGALVGQTFVPAAAHTSTGNGTGVDMILGDANNCNVLINYGVYNVATGDEVYTLNITESVDNSTFAALATPVSFVLSAPLGAAGTAGTQMLIVKRSHRYLRAELTVAGTSPSILLTVSFIEKLKISGVGNGSYSAPPTNY